MIPRRLPFLTAAFVAAPLLFGCAAPTKAMAPAASTARVPRAIDPMDALLARIDPGPVEPFVPALPSELRTAAVTRAATISSDAERLQVAREKLAQWSFEPNQGERERSAQVADLAFGLVLAEPLARSEQSPNRVEAATLLAKFFGSVELVGALPGLMRALGDLAGADRTALAQRDDWMRLLSALHERAPGLHRAMAVRVLRARVGGATAADVLSSLAGAAETKRDHEEAATLRTQALAQLGAAATAEH